MSCLSGRGRAGWGAGAGLLICVELSCITTCLQSVRAVASQRMTSWCICCYALPTLPSILLSSSPSPSFHTLPGLAFFCLSDPRAIKLTDVKAGRKLDALADKHADSWQVKWGRLPWSCAKSVRGRGFGKSMLPRWRAHTSKCEVHALCQQGRAAGRTLQEPTSAARLPPTLPAGIFSTRKGGRGRRGSCRLAGSAVRDASCGRLRTSLQLLPLLRWNGYATLPPHCHHNACRTC